MTRELQVVHVGAGSQLLLLIHMKAWHVSFYQFLCLVSLSLICLSLLPEFPPLNVENLIVEQGDVICTDPVQLMIL